MGEVRIWDLQAGSGAKPEAQWTSPDFTSWGTIKTHHYCGGIYGLAFSPDDASLLGCGMGPMTDPMAGNGKMTWQRWNWRNGERIDQIKDGQHGSGLIETVAWHPDGAHFLMAGRQAQGTWNAAIFSAADGNLVHSVDTKKRITHARFTADGQSLIISGANGQPARNPAASPQHLTNRRELSTTELRPQTAHSGRTPAFPGMPGGDFCSKRGDSTPADFCLQLAGSCAIIDSKREIGLDMAQLIVRQIEEKVVRKLKEQAGSHGLSMEEEHRRILRQALLAEPKRRPSFKEYLWAMPNVGPDALFERQRDFGRKVKL